MEVLAAYFVDVVKAEALKMLATRRAMESTDFMAETIVKFGNVPVILLLGRLI